MAHADQSLDVSPLNASTVRWRVVGLLMLFSALNYFNRLSMSVAGSEKIIPQGILSEEQMGLVYSAFLLTYTICMLPGGWLIDRLGGRATLGLMGLGSAALVALTALAGLSPVPAVILGTLLTIRGLAGIASAPIYPAAARMVGDWMPAPSRAWANGLVNGAAAVGTATTCYAFGYLMDQFGWPWAFVIAGGVTALAAVWWLADVTDRPDQHPGVNADELHLIGPLAEVDESAPVGTLAVTGRLLANRPLLLLTLSYAAVGYFEYVFFYWSEHYFLNVMHLEKEDARLYNTIVNLAMAVGTFLGGWLSDRAQAWLGSRRGRALVPMVGMVLSATFLVLGLMPQPDAGVLACFALAVAAVGACEGAFWTTAVDLGGRNGGTAAAILNTGGNVGGTFAPIATPVLAAWLGWSAGLGVASVFCVAGAVLWLGVRLGRDDSPA